MGVVLKITNRKISTRAEQSAVKKERPFCFLFDFFYFLFTVFMIVIWLRRFNGGSSSNGSIYFSSAV